VCNTCIAIVTNILVYNPCILLQKSSSVQNIEKCLLIFSDSLQHNCDSEELPEQLKARGRSSHTDDGKQVLEVHVPVVLAPTRMPVNLSSNLSDPIIGDASMLEKLVQIPDMKVPMIVFAVLEILILAFFTFDLVLRVFCCPCIIRYCMSIVNIADAAALIASYVHLAILFFFEAEDHQENWLDILKYLQMLRVLRLFRITNETRAGHVLAYTMYANALELFIVILFVFAGVCIWSSVFYLAELEDQNFQLTIPDVWYWAAITMTTVGYGDIYPASALGRVIAVACALTGVLLFALTIPIFANQFLALYNYADAACPSVKRPSVPVQQTKTHHVTPGKHCRELENLPGKKDEK